MHRKTCHVVLAVLALCLLTGGAPTHPAWAAEKGPGNSTSDNLSQPEGENGYPWPPYDPRWFIEAWQDDEVVTESHLRSILEQVPGQGYRIDQTREGPWPVRFVEGAFRITPHFDQGRCLKVGLVRPENLSFFVVSGNRAIELRYHPNFYQAWAAYAVGDDFPQNPGRPQRLALLGTDQGRYRRSGLGSVLLFWDGKELVLARGALRLLTVPLSGPPEELWMVGKTRLRELRWLSGIPIPPDDAPLFSSAPGPQPPWSAVSSQAVLPAASFGWSIWKTSPGLELNLDEHGRVEFAGTDVKERAYAGFSVPPSGAVEIVLKFDHVTPGTGFFVADRDRRPIAGLGFFKRSGRSELIFGFHSAQDDSWERGADDNQVVPLVGESQWFKLTIAAGVVKWWVSPDGKHWSLAAPTAENCDRQVAWCGLFLTRGQHRRIQLESLWLRPLVVPAEWCDTELFRQVPEEVYEESDWTRWCEAVVRSCPDVDLSRWWAACCVRTLQQNPPSYLGQRVLEMLWDITVQSNLPIGEKLAASTYLAALSSPRDWGIYERLPSRMVGMMWDELRRNECPAFSLLSDWILRCPYWAEWRLPAFPEALFRQELFAALAVRDGEHLARLGYTVQWAATPGSDAVPDSLRYLAGVALQRSGTGTAVAAAVLQNNFARAMEPLHLDIGRPAYNLVQELSAMLGQGDVSGAAQRILQASPAEMEGFFPASDDNDLWCSFPLYLERLASRFSGFSQTLAGLAAKVGQIQLEQAKNTGREDLAENVAMRVPGTTVAAWAAIWLGDRHMVLGRMAEALACYQRARSVSDAAVQQEVQRRLKLITSLVPAFGEVDSSSRPEPVTEQWISTTSVDSLEMTHLELRPGVSVETPGLKRPPAFPDREIDWPRAQVSFTPLDDLLLVHAQSDIRAYAKDGTLVWGQQSTIQGDQRALALVRMKPLVHEGRVIARRLEQRGTELVCLDLIDGHVVWNCRPGGDIVSDPWMVGTDVYALVAAETESERIELGLACVDPERGSLREFTKLFSLRNTINQAIDCQVTALGPQFVGQVRGVVFAGDVTGQVAWLRTVPWVAPPSDGWWPSQAWYAQDNSPPLVCGDTVIVTGRGSWCLCAVALSDGTLKWCCPMGRLLGILGESSGRLYVRTDNGLAILDTASGQLLAEIEHHDVDEWLRVHNPDGLVALQVQEDAQKRQVTLQMTFYNITDGRCLGYSRIPLPEKKAPWIGPIVRWDTELLLFTGHPSSPARRTSYQIGVVSDGG
ncbi:MAG: PQQ-binding-like beta-propeller repeat protein [Thermogutta sp.]|uniref:outer membrane protein assembly factor BamB family protein n=1 Tax=Thermogutta sp. TaxID=1962930 RepID=UPI0019A25FF6|nr:PQQ-binding-like beta-propeller repeat protein [Thermogutta sp.]MBC7351186.1 PQQ-binding-like beta-propeller repeat protein [Thermogutta sp.]